jgi:hypothetical protein
MSSMEEKNPAGGVKANNTALVHVDFFFLSLFTGLM